MSVNKEEEQCQLDKTNRQTSSHGHSHDQGSYHLCNQSYLQKCHDSGMAKNNQCHQNHCQECHNPGMVKNDHGHQHHSCDDQGSLNQV